MIAPAASAGYDRAVAGEPPQSSAQRREALKRVYAEAKACTRCPELASTRKSVVFGSGNADADLMFIGEAPGASEDERGIPFVGQAGKLLDKLLGEVGLSRRDVFIANTLKCRPPNNRDPLPVELENCRDYLYRQVELIEPKVICTLGNFATKLLRGDPTGITRLHGQEEPLTLGRRTVRLYPIFHPAAALYTPRMLQTLRDDFARIPALLALPAPEQQEWDERQASEAVDAARAGAAPPDAEQDVAQGEDLASPSGEEPLGGDQLGLF